MKNAILLAGGRGSRLAPITDTLPKPLVPFFDKTVIEYLLFRLAAYGIRNCLISVGYLADSIQKTLGYEYAGIRIRYLTEETPLGTAGGLAYAKEYLTLGEQEDFLVLSGDCITDFDFLLGEKDHRESHAKATVFTTQSSSPCEYGIVLSDADRRVIGFNEKPCWSQVNGNHVNTGVYILNSSVLGRIPHRKFDFSNDLFPELVRDNALYEHCAKGYWCDIGSPESYFACCLDVLNGKVRALHPESGFSVEELAARGVTAKEPFFVSRDATIAHGSHIGPNAVIGNGCFVGEGSCIENSILHPNCRAEAGCKVERSVLCRNSTVRKGGILSEAILRENGVVKSKNAPSSSESVFPIHAENFFVQDRNGDYVLGAANALPASNVADFGTAVFLASGKDEKIGLQYEGEKNVALYAEFLASGISRIGAKFTDFGSGFSALARFLSVKLGFGCFLFVYAEDEKIKLRIFNRNGLCPSHDFERRLRSALKNCGPIPPKRHTRRVFPDCSALYEGALAANFCAYLEKSAKQSDFSVAFRHDAQAVLPEEKLFRKVFCALSGKIISEQQAANKKKPILTYSRKGGFCFVDGENRYDFFNMLDAVMRKECRLGNTEFCLSDRWPDFPFEADYRAIVHRYPEESVRRFVFPNRLSSVQLCFRDELLLCARTVSLLFGEQKSVSDLFPTSFSIVFSQSRYFLADSDEKMRVIDAFSRFEHGNRIKASDCYEGIRIEYPYGAATVIPERLDALRVLTQAKSVEAAKSLCECFEKDLLKTAPDAQKEE